MLGKDYQTLGTQEGISLKIDEPIEGPIKIKFISRDLIGIIDVKKTLHLHSLSKGPISKIKSDPYSILNVEDEEDIVNKQLISNEKYLKMFIYDMTPLSTKSIAICGKNPNIEVMDIITNQFLTPIARKAEARELHNPNFSSTNIEAFTIGKDTLICSCQSAVNRVQVFDVQGNVLASLGGEAGVLPGQFRHPVSISCYTDITARSSNIDTQITPLWYNEKPSDNLLDQIKFQPPGSFFVVKKLNTDIFFDLFFVDDYENVNNCTITMESSSFFVMMFNGVEYTGDSVLSLLKSFKYLKNVRVLFFNHASHSSY